MTTIAYRNGTLAADSRLTKDRLYIDGCTKIAAFNKRMVGFAGDFSLVPAAIDFMREHSDHPIHKLHEVWDDFPGELSGIVVMKDSREVYSIEDGPPVRLLLDDDFFAIGSGAGYALGAMAHGADAVEAVKTAARFDLLTGGRIATIHLKDILF